MPFYETWIEETFLIKKVDGADESDLYGSKLIGRFLSDYLLVFMFLRFFFVLRTVFNFSIYNDEYSKKLCRHHGVSSGIRFTLKCLLNKYPELTIFWLFVITIIVLSYIIRIFELPISIKELSALTFYE